MDTIISKYGSNNLTESPTDDDWDDDELDEIDEQEALEDGVDDYIITRRNKGKKTIED